MIPFIFSRLLADCLGFAGALGIQVIVTSLQEDRSEEAGTGPQCVARASSNSTVTVSDTLTVQQFLHHRTVAAVIILIASLLQGAFSQVAW